MWELRGNPAGFQMASTSGSTLMDAANFAHLGRTTENPDSRIVSTSEPICLFAVIPAQQPFSNPLATRRPHPAETAINLAALWKCTKFFPAGLQNLSVYFASSSLAVPTATPTTSHLGSNPAFLHFRPCTFRPPDSPSPSKIHFEKSSA